MSSTLTIRPRHITIDRTVQTLQIVWLDGLETPLPLGWLRANCPCATCREDRRAAEADTDLLKLSSGPLPSTDIAGAELVGNYAVRLAWTDGHDSGIYAFSALREIAEARRDAPDELPPLLPG